MLWHCEPHLFCAHFALYLKSPPSLLLVMLRHRQIGQINHTQYMYIWSEIHWASYSQHGKIMKQPERTNAAKAKAYNNEGQKVYENYLAVFWGQESVISSSLILELCVNKARGLKYKKQAKDSSADFSCACYMSETNNSQRVYLRTDVSRHHINS